MPCRRLAAVLTAGAALIAGCGSSNSSKQPSAQTQAAVASGTTGVAGDKPGAQLTPSQLRARAEAICYRANVRRRALRISKRSELAILVPPLAAYELAVAVEMATITPPASLASDWQKMVSGSRAVAEATGRYGRVVERVPDTRLLRPAEQLQRGIAELTQAAKHAGFVECSQFR